MPYDVPESAARYILLQRTEYLTFTNRSLPRFIRRLIPSLDYRRWVEFEARLNAGKVIALYMTDMEKEYESIKDFLPPICSRILDIGCGIAGIDVLLYEHYSNEGIEFFLLDKSAVEENIYYDYEEKGAFYNSLELSEETLVRNGVDRNRIHLLEASEGSGIDIEKPVDLALSLLSWGFHYPVGTYLEQVHGVLDVGGVLILDVRKGTGGLDQIREKFGHYTVVREDAKYTRVCATKSRSTSNQIGC